MRIPGWLFIVGAVLLIGLTALCSILSFSATQRVVVDLSSRGVTVGSPFELARTFLTNRDALSGPTASDNSFDSFVAALPTATPTLMPPTATLEPGVTAAPTTAAPTPTLDPMADIPEWNDPRRFTLLLLGIDQRTGVQEDEPAFRTDTIMVINVDPVRMRAGVLSIPRDLWVSIPGYSEQRINTANFLGDSQSYPGGGPALAAATIEQNLGIDIDKYVRINFDVFTSVVNLVAPNGVEICVQETIDDPTYPDAGFGFIHVHFDPGCQRLDAEKLLQYARTRHTDGGDFDRARRQQEVIRALMSEVLSAGGISNFVGQAAALWEELSTSITTDMSLEEMLSLANLAQQIDMDTVAFNTIDNMAVNFATTSSGDQVLIPNYNAIRALIQDTFNPPEPLAEGDLRQRATAENARIVLYNNTDIAGLARTTQEWMISQGVTIESVGNMPEPNNMDTTIRLYTDKTYAAQYLASLLGIPNDRIQRSNDGLTSADIMVVIGPDIQPLLTGSAP
jgi:LCP family protein required for cell wall assembly